MSTGNAPATDTDAPKTSWKPMPFIALGVAMIITDSTIVNVAIPSIIRDIGLSTTGAEWMNAIYSLVFASLLLTTGRLGDRYGRKRLFLIGTITFVAASMFCAAATSTEMLLVGRFLQGVGGALILPASLSTVNALYRGKDRAVAFGIWGATIGGAAAIGPLLGGYLTEHLSWRWAFGINIPLGIIIVYGLLRHVPETKNQHETAGWDIPGALLSTLGMGLLVLSLIEGQNYGWVEPIDPPSWWPVDGVSPILFSLILSGMALVAFVIVERQRRRAGRTVLVDLSLFSIATFKYGNITAMIVSLGEFGLLFALPLFLQSVLGLNPLETGYCLLALAIGSFFAGPTAGQMAGKIGVTRVVRTGMVLEMIGILGIGFVISPTASAWAFVPWLFVYGLGVGFATAQITGVVMQDVPVEQSGQGSAVQSTARQIGAALGTAILGAILVTSLRTEAATAFESAGMPAEQARQTAQAVAKAPSAVIPGLPPVMQAAAGESFSTATRHVAWSAAGFIGLGLLASFALPSDRRRKSDA